MAMRSPARKSKAGAELVAKAETDTTVMSKVNLFISTSWLTDLDEDEDAKFKRQSKIPPRYEIVPKSSVSR